MTTARNLKPGDVVLVDPLDPSSAFDVVEVGRSNFSSSIELLLVHADGRIAEATLAGSQLVKPVVR